jgi:hypothetical protein
MFKTYFLGMHWISGWPDIWPDNPSFFKDSVSDRILWLDIRPDTGYFK